jgi:hypothetical protein
VTVLLALGAGALAVWLWVRSGAVFRNDFIQYWAAGRLLLAHADPYDPNALFSLQQAAGWTGNQPAVMFNPPWTLSLFLLPALLPAGAATGFWLLLQIPVVTGCAAVLWRLYGGERREIGWAVLLGFLFPPVAWTVMFGQASGFLLLGLVLFLLAVRAGAWTLAGMALSLTAVKPHIVLLVWLAVALWALREGRWQVLVGGLTGLLLLSVLPFLLEPGVFAAWIRAFATRPPNRYVSDTLGMALRLLFGRQHVWVQFVPLAGGAAWVVAHWWSRRTRWSWSRELPLAALVSAALAPYGWFFDLVVAVPALLELTVRARALPERRGRTGLLAGYLVFCAIFTGLHFAFWDPYAFVHGWLGGFLLLSYLWLRRVLAPIDVEPTL